MPMWRCPHCATPQAESARCWVCHRSSTSCGTCRHFRRAVAANIGYCGLDRARRPLAGDELRGCWEAAPASATSPAGTEGVRPSAAGPASRRLDFIEVTPRPERASQRRRGAMSGADTVSGESPEGQTPPPTAPAQQPGWSLWGDPDL